MFNLKQSFHLYLASSTLFFIWLTYEATIKLPVKLQLNFALEPIYSAAAATPLDDYQSKIEYNFTEICYMHNEIVSAEYFSALHPSSHFIW